MPKMLCGNCPHTYVPKRKDLSPWCSKDRMKGTVSRLDIQPLWCPLEIARKRSMLELVRNVRTAIDHLERAIERGDR